MPRQFDVASATPGERASSARNEDEKNSEYTGHHGQRKQPADDQLPPRQREQEEVQRLAKHRVHEATSAARCVPEERDRRPLRHHAGASYSGNCERKAKCDEAQHRLNRQLQRLSANENRVTARQIGQMRSLQSQKRSEQNKKCGCRKGSKDSPLKAQRFPQYVSVAEGPEPEHVHVIRKRGPTAENDNGEDGENEEKEA